MSAVSAPVAGRPARGRAPAGESRPALRDPAIARPLVRVVAFTALALYAAVRWGTMLTPAPTNRLLGLVALAGAVAGAGPLLGARSRVLATVVTTAAAIAMLAVAGLPLDWIWHVRISVSANAIGEGLRALPRLLVPYRGINDWVRMVILLGAGVLLLDAAAMVAFSVLPAGGEAHGTGDFRRAVATLPLIALAAVPLTLVPSKVPYFQGMILFALLALFIWGERLPRARSGAAVSVCALGVVVAMVAAPAIDAHKPWIDYQSFGAGIAAGSSETFDWSQTYGPLTWPQDGREVLEVEARQGDYWKAVNLDIFDGTGWATAGAPLLDVDAGISPATRRRFTQTLTVIVGAMSTPDVLGAGEMEQPYDATQVIGQGLSPGTWVAANPLGEGDSYRVVSYSPHPSSRELAAAGTAYPDGVATQYLALTLPTANAAAYGNLAAVDVAPFGATRRLTLFSSDGQNPQQLIDASPYAPVYALAQRLRAGARTPYAYVENVLHYLRRHDVYDLNTKVTPYPLITFLFHSHRGYCQQFAGAMALLLRFGGVPARVVAGFTSGDYDASTRRYVVSDFDAHAWVEAFFPGYGWVRFDPTPPTQDPALARSALGSLLPSGSAVPALPSKPLNRHGLGVSSPTAVHRAAHGGGGAATTLLVPGLAALIVLAGLALALTRPLGAGTEILIAELERAFARSGRPLDPGVTLAEVERRLHGVPEAEAYVRALSRARFAGTAEPPSAAGRRAVRRHLRTGLGAGGALRALWALPPRRRWRLVPDGLRGAGHDRPRSYTEESHG